MIPPYLSIILPAHNEGARLDACLTELTDYLFGCTVWPFEILIIDNGSTDDTEAVGGLWSEAWPQVRYIRICERGKGIAVRTGMLEAVGRYRYMADVDLSTPANEIQKFVSAMQGTNADLLIGVRHRLDTSLLRRAMSAGFHAITRTLVPYRDTQCGFKMFTYNAAEDIFQRAHVNGMAFDVEALYLADRLGYTVHQLPVNWTASGSSRVRLVRDSWQMFQDVLQIRRTHSIPTRVSPAQAG